MENIFKTKISFLILSITLTKELIKLLLSIKRAKLRVKISKWKFYDFDGFPSILGDFHFGVTRILLDHQWLSEEPRAPRVSGSLACYQPSSVSKKDLMDGGLANEEVCLCHSSH